MYGIGDKVQANDGSIGMNFIAVSFLITLLLAFGVGTLLEYFGITQLIPSSVKDGNFLMI